MRLGPTINLSGTWQMQHEEVGLDRPKSDLWCNVPVPMPWTAFFSPASGVSLNAVPDRMAWFRRSIAVPVFPPLSRLLVHFDAVNFRAVVFVNGRLCSEHVGDAIPFDVDITDFTTPGELAELLVGVQDISAAAEQGSDTSRRGARELLYPGLAHYPGIWGPVSLHVVPELHISDVRIRVSLPGHTRGGEAIDDGRISVRATIKNGTDRALGFSLTNELYDGARQVLAFAPVRGVVNAGGETIIEVAATWRSAALWWPDSPHMFTLRSALWSDLASKVEITGGTMVDNVVDRVHTAVGFREFRVKGTSFMLNNVPIQLRSEALCPVSGQLFGEMRPGAAPIPADPAGFRALLEDLKRKLGVNAVRFHRIPPLPSMLEAADQVGMLVIVEFPLPDDEGRYAVENPRFWANASDLARRWVLARAHHPSIVMWSVGQGMVRQYGMRAAEGLVSLARTVADTDPTRPVENSGDAALADAGSLGVAAPVSVFMPTKGVSFRSAGRYEPEAVRGRVLPTYGEPEAPWEPDRPATRPLCLMEHVRRVHTPPSLAFFLGDAAYSAGINLADAAAPLAMLEMGACRVAGLASIHTIGRPSGPRGMSNTANEVVALPVELFANFYAGSRFVENIMLRNDTRFDQDFQLTARFTVADGRTSEHREELLLPAGTEEPKVLAFNLPDIRKVQDAGNAVSVLAELRIDFAGSRVGRFEHRRKIAIWPHVRATGTRRIGLYDPDGRTAMALSAVGAQYAAAHGAPHDEFDTIIIGENALEAGLPADPTAFREFVSRGGLVIVLAQRTTPYDFSPVTTILDIRQAASIAFVRDAEHPILRGLSSFEMRWWQDDHRVASSCFRKPTLGNFRCLADVGGRGGLRWAVALEVFHGAGSYLFSQMEMAEKIAGSPIAGLLLARLADAAPTWRPLRTKIAGNGGVFAQVGVGAQELSPGFGEEELEKTDVVLLTREDVAALSTVQVRALHDWVQAGGCLYVHNLVPGMESVLASLAGCHVALAESPQENLVFGRPGVGLARGLSSADLYFSDHGAWTLGGAPRRVDAATVITTAKGHAVGVASAVDSPREHGLLTVQAGMGRIVIDQVCWHIETAADARAGRYISTLLTNLGVPLSPPSLAERSARCELVDISVACNARLRSFLWGEEDGWTGRGPDSDLSAFAPGLLIAAGVPFRVAEESPGQPYNCCVLRPGREPVAPPIALGREVSSLGFLIACEGHAKHGTAVAHFTVRYEDGLQTQVPLRFGVDVFDWNERGRHLDNARVAWRGATGLGEPAVLYARIWDNSRPAERVRSLQFSSARAGVVPILLAATALT